MAPVDARRPTVGISGVETPPPWQPWKDVMNSELGHSSDATRISPLRSRTVTWQEPGPGIRKGAAMSGLDYLLAMKSGELPKPPFAGLIQIDITSVEPGRVVFVGQPDESMYNAAGVIHGGVVGMLLDTLAGCALQSTLPVGKGVHLGRDRGELAKNGPARQQVGPHLRRS